MKFDIEFGTIGEDGKFVPSADGLDFRAVRDIECGADSLVISRAWAKIAIAGDGASFRFDAYTVNKVLGNSGSRYIKTASGGTNGADFWELPGMTRCVTLTGKRDSAQTMVSASLLALAK